MKCYSTLQALVCSFILLFSSACSPEQECVEIDVEIVVTDTRSGRDEGSARVQANFGGIYNYKWDRGLTISKIEGLPPGRYCVTVTSSETPECETILCEEVEAYDAIGNQDVDDGQTKILFIGNSHTFYNDLPATVENIVSKSKLPQPIVIKQSVKGGWRFENHAEDIETTETIRSSNWDYVVLQENAGYASVNQDQAENVIYPFAEKLYDQIIDNNPKTQIILYMTHAYEEGIENCVTNPDRCTYELMQNEIRRNYLHINGLIESKIAPAGILWKMIRAKELDIDLFHDDTTHPSPEGSQVSAAVVATIISGEPLKASYLDSRVFMLSESTLVKELINNALFEGKPDWKTF